MIPRKMRSHSDRSTGRTERFRKIPLDVPPRKNVAGRGFGVEDVMEEVYLLRFRHKFALVRRNMGVENPGFRILMIVPRTVYYRDLVK